MKCCKGLKTEQHSDLDNIDRALHDLGMLSAITDARREYIRESKSDVSLLQMNSRYVSNVTVGFCMKKTTNKNRLCPYTLPPRHRTKSENSETVVESDYCYIKVPLETKVPPEMSSSKCLASLKRCQSLESLLTPGEKVQETQDVEGVSKRIQKLHVDE